MCAGNQIFELSKGANLKTYRVIERLGDKLVRLVLACNCTG